MSQSGNIQSLLCSIWTVIPGSVSYSKGSQAPALTLTCSIPTETDSVSGL